MGGVWPPGDFLDLAGRNAVGKTLKRRVAWRDLWRIDHGLYDKPSFNSRTRQDNTADPKAVFDAVARRTQIRVLVDDMAADYARLDGTNTTERSFVLDIRTSL